MDLRPSCPGLWWRWRHLLVSLSVCVYKPDMAILQSPLDCHCVLLEPDASFDVVMTISRGVLAAQHSLHACMGPAPVRESQLASLDHQAGCQDQHCCTQTEGCPVTHGVL